MRDQSKYPVFPTTNSPLSGLLNEFFNNNLSNFIGSDMGFFQPSVNILETPDAFIIELAAPGFEKHQFKMNVENHRLRIEARKETEQTSDNKRYTRREFQVASFERIFDIPEAVNQNEITAVYTNGVLEITLPKKEQAKPLVKTIEIGGE
jgi:HSP20 family protein